MGARAGGVKVAHRRVRGGVRSLLHARLGRRAGTSLLQGALRLSAGKGDVGVLTLEHVAMQARPYPTELLEGCETGLVLFAAAFLGHNDAIHFAEAGITTSCVDIDSEGLAEMRELYPDSWAFVTVDAWHFAEACASEGVQWDAVSVDTFSGDATRRSLDSLEL